MNHKNNKKSHHESGSTLIEGSLALALVLLFIFALIDFTRYLVIKASMEYGVHSAVDVASKLISLDENSADAAADWANFERSRNEVLAEAVRLPYAMLLKPPDTVGSTNRLLAFTFNGPNHPLETKYGTSQTAAILVRPGERYKCPTSGTGCTTQPNYDHPTCPFPAALSVNGNATCDEGNYDATLTNHPLIVELRAQFSFITPIPIRRTIEIRARAMAYRELRPDKNNGTGSPVSIPTTQPTNSQNFPTSGPTAAPTIAPTPASTVPPPVSPAPTPTPAPACPLTVCVGIGVELSSFPTCVCACIAGRIMIQDEPLMKICVENPD